MQGGAGCSKRGAGVGWAVHCVVVRRGVGREIKRRTLTRDSKVKLTKSPPLLRWAMKKRGSCIRHNQEMHFRKSF